MYRFTTTHSYLPLSRYLPNAEFEFPGCAIAKSGKATVQSDTATATGAKDRSMGVVLLCISMSVRWNCGSVWLRQTASGNQRWAKCPKSSRLIGSPFRPKATRVPLTPRLPVARVRLHLHPGAAAEFREQYRPFRLATRSLLYIQLSLEAGNTSGPADNRWRRPVAGKMGCHSAGNNYWQPAPRSRSGTAGKSDCMSNRTPTGQDGSDHVHEQVALGGTRQQPSPRETKVCACLPSL